MRFTSYLHLLRPANLLMLALGVGLGFWLGHAPGHALTLAGLVIAAVCAAGFGNVVNDIADIETDKISHPRRPLAAGELRATAAAIFAAALACLGTAAAFLASWQHGLGTLVPLGLLLLYALFFKATPLVGNILISLLVGYGIVFGGLLGAGMHRLAVPAILAFLLNASREIVKDVQDDKGDRLAGLKTTASLSRPVIKRIVAACGILYAVLVAVPFLLHDFGLAYALVCLVAVAPLHVYWCMLFFNPDWERAAGRMSSFIKYEMVCGMAALALDGFVHAVMR
jgi:geranylgeranylglycerol-phosphate geranylgeranyltransferase